MLPEPPANSVHPKSRRAWRTWLTKHHNRQEGLWFISYKKGSCLGWIDSKPNKLDEERSMLWIAPRKTGTGWSKLNMDWKRKNRRHARKANRGNGQLSVEKYPSKSMAQVA